MAGRNATSIQSLPMNAEHSDIPVAKSHATLSPRTNLLLLFVWATGVGFAFLLVRPRLPVALGLIGGLLGALAGMLQHLSISQDPSGFVAASSLMGVRRALTSTAWGRKYIAWLYFCNAVLLLLAFMLIRQPLFQVVLGYLGAYFSLMLVRDAVTLRDTYLLRSLGNTSSPR
jgi:hypothetical protein